MPGFLLSGKVAEKPQDIAPKHLKGKVVLFSESIKRKRRWRGPASRSSRLGATGVWQRLGSAPRVATAVSCVGGAHRQERRVGTGVWASLACLRRTLASSDGWGCPICPASGRPRWVVTRCQAGERPTLLTQVEPACLTLILSLTLLLSSFFSSIWPGSSGDPSGVSAFLFTPCWWADILHEASLARWSSSCGNIQDQN